MWQYVIPIPLKKWGRIWEPIFLTSCLRFLYVLELHDSQTIYFGKVAVSGYLKSMDLLSNDVKTLCEFHPCSILPYKLFEYFINARMSTIQSKILCSRWVCLHK